MRVQAETIRSVAITPWLPHVDLCMRIRAVDHAESLRLDPDPTLISHPVIGRTGAR